MASLPIQLVYEFYNRYGDFVVSFSEDFIKLPLDYFKKPKDNYVLCRILGNYKDIPIPSIGSIRIIIIDMQFQTQFRVIFHKKYDSFPKRKRKFDSNQLISEGSFYGVGYENCSVLINSIVDNVDKIKITISYSSIIKSIINNNNIILRNSINRK
jgi:hypothetical protein